MQRRRCCGKTHITQNSPDAEFAVGERFSAKSVEAYAQHPRIHKIATCVSNSGGERGVPMKFLYIASGLLAAAVAGCGTLSVPGTPETATSLNGFRASHGLSQLRTDGTLAALASEHAADMARRDSLDHDGFMTHRGPRGARAENVGYGCKESACVIQQWGNSSGHRKNMLIPSLTRYGLASATTPSGKKYWALLVGE
jgi:Cysteine-rich secretory protein family